MAAAKSQANHLTRVHRANTVVIKYHCVTMTENGVMLSSASAERPKATKQFNVFNLYWLSLSE